MKRIHPCSYLIMSACVAVLCAARPATSAARPGPLDDEERLAKKLDLHVVEEPLVDLLEQVARETGTPLAAAEETADERITILARERPARELLNLAAKHLDYSWVTETRKGVKTLVLTQDAAARKREEALRGGAQRDLAALKEQVEAYERLLRSPEVQKLAQLPREARMAHLDQIDERLNGRIVIERVGNETRFRRERDGRPTPQERETLEREQRLLHAAAPEGLGAFSGLDAAARVYGGLSDDQRAALWQGLPVRFAYPPEQERVALRRETAAELAANGLGHLVTRTDEATGRDVPVPVRETERVRGDLWLEGRGVEVRLQVRIRMLGSVGDERSSTRAERVFTDELRSGRGLRPTGAVTRLDETSTALPDPVTFPAEPRPPTPKRQPETTRFSEVLEKLAGQVSYPIVADGYATGPFSGPFPADRKPLGEVLERLCRVYDRTCRHENGVLLLRHRDWATRRAMEPPARRVKAWEKRLTQQSALPMTDLVEIGGRLTPEQIEALQLRWRGRIPEGAYWLLSDHLKRGGAVLRMLSPLPAATRRTLDSGRALPVRSLPPASRLPLWKSLLAPLAKIGGYENRAPGGVPVVLGAGFEAEDRLEAAWGQGTLAVRRTPAAWLFTRDHYFPASQLDQALALERGDNPKATEEDLKRVDGEQVEVLLALPGSEPIRYLFLTPLGPKP